MFAAARLMSWQESTGEGRSSEVFTALLTSPPAHRGSLITESFACCPFAYASRFQRVASFTQSP